MNRPFCYTKADMRKSSVFAAPIPVAAFISAVLAKPALAQGLEGYEEPNLQIKIPNVDFSNVTVSDDGTKITVPYLANYITGIYSYAIGIATVVAAVMAVIGGFQYLTAGGDAGRVKAAKERITDAIAGVILTLGAFALLNTVSPSLVRQTGLEIPVVKALPVIGALELAEDPADNVAPTSGGRIGNFAYCRSVDECAMKCIEDEDNFPKDFGDNVAPDDMKTIPSTVGLVGNGKLASEITVSGLIAAGKIADATGTGYRIFVRGGYRPFSQQLRSVCNMIKNGDTATLGSSVAWPGSSIHGTGNAVDIELHDKVTGKIVVGALSCSRQNATGESALATPEMAKLFAEIMAKAGASRYSNEVWHFEFGTVTKPCRCKGSACPTPPMTCKGNC